MQDADFKRRYPKVMIIQELSVLNVAMVILHILVLILVWNI